MAVQDRSVLDDPGELIRFWLWHQKERTARGFNITNLAAAIGAKKGTVSAWLTRPRSIPTFYWNPMARFFEKRDCRVLEDEAATLWAIADERRGYVPLLRLQARRVTRVAAGRPRARVPSATPAVVAAFLRETAPATRSRRRPRVAPAGRVRSKRETQPVG